jgi:uncharacterized protein
MFCGKFSLVQLTITATFVVLSLGLSACTTAVPSANHSASSAAPPAPMASPILPMGGQTLPITAKAQIGALTVQLEVAETPEQQSMGLMYRPPLPDDRGMLFPMDPPRSVAFWMRNVPVPLDMVFIYQGKIVAIASKVPPCATASCPTYGPRGLVDQVLELRAGRAEELGLKSGDPIVITKQ